MKTVIHYIADVYLSVTETWIYEQIKNLKRYKPIVYALKTENLNIYPTEKLRSLALVKGIGNLKNSFNKGWNKLFHFYPGFIFPLIKDRPQLVHAHFGPSGYNFLPLKNLFRLPLITTFYGYDLSFLPSQYPQWMIRYRKLFREGELFLVEGNYMKKSLVKLGCPEEKIIVQHLGVDLEKIRFMPRKISGNNEIKVLISASFREKKGIPYGVKAFGRVKRAHPELNLKLTIIGDSGRSPREEAEKGKIFSMIQKYQLKDYVNMLGYQPYPVFLRELYKHHIFLHPSLHACDGDDEGGAPVCIIEASASGMPVLTTYHCDIPEVILDGKSGFLVLEQDTDALTEKLEYLINHHKIWIKMGKAGKEHVKENYNVIKQGRELEKIYRKMLVG